MRRWLVYEIELVTLLMLVITAGVTYGILEARYIPTDTMQAAAIPGTNGHFAYYHLCLLSLMAVASFALAILHVREIALHRKKYTILMGLAALPFSLLVEDITWFCVRGQAIRADEWTVWPTGWAISLGFTYVPLWYFAVLLFSAGMWFLASKCATLGYKKFLTQSTKAARMSQSSPTPARAGSRQRKAKWSK